MKQLILFGKPLDQYRARINGKLVYFDSLPIPSKLLIMKKNWDDKFILKQEFEKHNTEALPPLERRQRLRIPIPGYLQFPIFYPQSAQKIKNTFSRFELPIIVKPRVGSRGRHTVTKINTLDEFKVGIEVVKKICAYLVAEEHIFGDVCRATFVNGKLMGFYRGAAPYVVGDGAHTVAELILEKDTQRRERVEKVLVNDELENYVLRSGFKFTDVLPLGLRLSLTHRTGRLFGGVTREMLDELHPSFIPILNRAAEIVGLPVIGFDCIILDPTKDASTQKWGIIECNTLPFIDLHYYALEGKPKNIAGAIWDLWK